MSLAAPCCCRLRAVPEPILAGCSALATLSLHGNPLTAEALRQAPGWRQFDERRRQKYDKQVRRWRERRFGVVVTDGPPSTGTYGAGANG